MANYNKIQFAAAQLVAIQEAARQKGSFSPEENKFYADSLQELGVAAQNLAKLQQTRNVSLLDYVSNTNGNSNTPANDSYMDDGVLINAPKKEASVAESKPSGIFFHILTQQMI